MIKTVTLSGKELMVEGLGGFNTIVHNLSDDAVYASKSPNIKAGADDVAEVPAGAAKLISTTNGTVYLLGTGKAELTGQDHDGVNFRQPSSSGGGDGTSDVTKEYVSAQDALNLEAAKTYTDNTLDAAKEEIEQVCSEAFDKIASNAMDISVLQTDKADKSEIPTTLPANGGNADTVNGHTVNIDVPADAKFTDTTYKAMTGATSSAAGKAGLVPAPAAGKQASFLKGDGTWAVPTNTTYSAMTGASASAAGKAGLVPAPAAGAQAKYLRGDGTWQTPTDTNTTYSAMTGASASAAGKAGLVPAPAAGKQASFLRGDGTWAVPTNTTYSIASPTNDGLMSKNDKIKLNSTQSISAIVQGTVSSLSHTYNMGWWHTPYRTGASKVLVEVWDSSNDNYGSFYKTGMSSNMTAVSTTELGFSGSIVYEITSKGEIGFGGANPSRFMFRATWFI